MSAKNISCRKVVIRAQTMVRQFQPSSLLETDFLSLANSRAASVSPCFAALSNHLAASAKSFVTPYPYESEPGALVTLGADYWLK
jgi:hypothetical protein